MCFNEIFKNFLNVLRSHSLLLVSVSQEFKYTNTIIVKIKRHISYLNSATTLYNSIPYIYITAFIINDLKCFTRYILQKWLLNGVILVAAR